MSARRVDRLADHPTVRAVTAHPRTPAAEVLDAADLRGLCFELGAADVGFVEVERPALAAQRADITRLLPTTKTLISFVLRMNREPIRNTARSISNVEFHQVGHDVDGVGHAIVHRLEARGIQALNVTMGFPMEVDRERPWVLEHKPIAVAAGLGKMGIHRNVIHPRFGNFILLGTVLIDRRVKAVASELSYNPCLECNLCVAACPVGAIGNDGSFDFGACLTHNYREFLGGFSDWVGNVVDSKSRADYGERVAESETLSMWQSLSFGANYKSAYCLAVCPAGEDVIAPFLHDRKGYLDRVVRPLQGREEPVYVIADSNAEHYVQRRFPHKTPRRVRGALRARSIRGFLFALPILFQSDAAAGLAATYHFIFTGNEPREATVEIRDKRLTVTDGLRGRADLRVTVDGASWLRFLAGEVSLVRLLLTRKLRLRGRPTLLLAFGRCFPS